jgi:hypothetical protein
MRFVPPIATRIFPLLLRLPLPSNHDVREPVSGWESKPVASNRGLPSSAVHVSTAIRLPAIIKLQDNNYKVALLPDCDLVLVFVSGSTTLADNRHP